MKITVFGDSVLKGVITTPQTTSLFDVTEKNSLALAQKELGFELDNRSIYGNIITKGQLKFNKWLEKGGSADICIIEFGDNDSDYDWPPISQNPDGEYVNLGKTVVLLPYANGQKFIVIGVVI